MNLDSKPEANRLLVFREEFDDWAILFDPDTGDSCGLNPVSALIWKLLNGKRTIGHICDEIAASCEKVPENVEQDVMEFIQELISKGYAGYEYNENPPQP